tara:strand:- start:21 stop:1205 length:1185 start_codon:yes stop_codon:yes gene_type:complete
MEKIKFLVGNKEIKKISLSPYDKEVLDFLGDLSEDLNLTKDIKNYPDIKTFAFFCRNKNLIKLKKNFLVSSRDIRLGLGLIFHITPSNIPTNFAYSLIFGLLTGNSNIVKVPSRDFKQIDIISKSINKILSKKYKKVKEMIKIVKYKNNESFTKKISSICDARLIWGGDQTIENIRKYNLHASAIDLTFADRYSLCIIDTKKFLKAKYDNLTRIVERFYNDTYVADQNACSSPHMVLWLGKKSHKAKSKFWEELSKLVEKKYNLTHDAAIEKYTELCKKIINDKNVKSYRTYTNNVYTVVLKNLNGSLDTYRGKWGFFYEYDIKKLEQIKKYINKKFQTLTYFGVEKVDLKDFIIKNKLQGIDRIVPIGQALDIGFYWDGYDINNILTRVVDIR